jgi:CRP/FNR family transcriptional regulator
MACSPFLQVMSHTTFDEIFNNFTIFAGMDDSQRDLLKQYVVVCECAVDEVIFEQGDPAEFLYVVAEGEVAIQFKPDDGPALVVSRLKEGEVFGWSAAFGSGQYTSGAVCTCPSVLLRMRGDNLKMLRENHPETGILVLERLATSVLQRLNNPRYHAQVMAFLEHGLKNGVRPIGG